MPKGKINYDKVKAVRLKIGEQKYSFDSTIEACFFLYLLDIKMGNIKDHQRLPINDLNCGLYNPNKKRQKQILFFKREPFQFTFNVPKTNKVQAYIPDFFVVFADGTREFYEIKGRMSQRNITQFQLIKEQYPKLNLFVIYVKKGMILSDKLYQKYISKVHFLQI
jgi:hypothetical protein